MNNEITLEEFLVGLMANAARFGEVVRTGWVENAPCSAEAWAERMKAVAGTVYPGEKPIQYKDEWEDERKRTEDERKRTESQDGN